MSDKNKIIPINASDRNITEFLEDMLELAREGKFDHIAVVAVTTDNQIYEGLAWARPRNYLILGGLHSLSFTVNSRYIQQNADA